MFFDVFCVKISLRVYAIALLKNPKKRTKKTSHPKGTAKSRIWREETPQPISTKFCVPGAIQHIIKPANFGKDRFRGFSVANFGLFH